MRRTAALGSAVAVAVGARLAHGPGALGYDALWGLRWGHEILHGRTPSFTAAAAPTPHPLVNAASALLELLGTDAATSILLAASWLSLGALAVALFALGARIFNPWAGLFAAAAIVTRQLIVAETGQALADLPFLVLVVAALAHEARRPREGWTVPVLLALAGLLRPEAWALSAAYGLWRREARIIPLLLVAPLLWAGMDLWATGDALHSLHGTRDLGVALDRPRSTRTALTLAPAVLRDIVQQPLLWVCLAGALGGLLSRERDSVLPGALVVLGLAGYLVLGVAGLPLLGRYLLLPATMLVLFAGLAVFGWRDDPRMGWRLLGAAAAVAVLAGIPADADKLSVQRGFDARRHAVQEDLRAAARTAPGCREVRTPDRRTRAVVVAQRLGMGGRDGTLFIAARDPAAVADFAIGRFDARPLPAGARVVARGRYWVTATSASC